MQPLKTLRTADRNLAEYPSQQNVVKQYQIADWLGKLT
jgi:hypothetical protein